MHPEDTAQRLTDQANRSAGYQRWAYARRPKALGDIVAQLIAKKGYGAVQTNRQLDEAWAESAGPRLAPFSQAARLNRGRLEVTVANSTMMQELTFEKQRILAAVREALPDARIDDLKLRIGKIK